ncbi:MAG: MerR family transcriptional regulator [Solirubrobacterales bacterium]|nr:MerR family transcriptional regulator [Solirubrobacterales bacterium]
MSTVDDAALGIGEISSRSGVAEGTLRMWEARYGFPEPRRLPSGHRRYSKADLERVRIVVRAREEGLPLPLAIRRAVALGAGPQPSVYAALRHRFPYLHPQAVSKPTLLVISRAIEDECTSRAPHPVLLAGFQRERFYRQVQPRWIELARTARRAIVMADFHRLRRRRGAPAEVPLAPEDPLMREWILVWDAPELAACLVAWERPPQGRAPRRFEFIWTAEPEVVREAARQCCKLVAREAPELVEDLRERLADAPEPAIGAHLRATVELATRIAMYASGEQDYRSARTPSRRPRGRSR